jgi:hypothetical protein
MKFRTELLISWNFTLVIEMGVGRIKIREKYLITTNCSRWKNCSVCAITNNK